MKIAESKTRSEFPLSTRKIVKKTVGGSILWTVLLLVLYPILAFSAVAGGVSKSLFLLGTVAVLVLFAIIIWTTYLYQKWYFSVYYYDLGQDYVVIKKGPITPHEITIPYERIQDVYVDQDLLDRFFGLYDVHLSSATVSSGMEAHIDGVEKAGADGLKAHLLGMVSERISKKKTVTTL